MFFQSFFEHAQKVLPILFPVYRLFWQNLYKYNIRPILQIHDELLFEVDDGHEQEAINIIRSAMERQPFEGFDIPIVAEGEHGLCFGKLHELEETT